MVDVAAQMENLAGETSSGGDPRIEFVMLADKAEVINGKLYVMGGCWDHAWGDVFPLVYPTSIAVRILLPDAPGAERLRLDFHIDGPGKPEVEPKGLILERSGETDGLSRESATVAVTSALVLPQPGRYRLHVSINGKSGRSLDFVVGQLSEAARSA